MSNAIDTRTLREGMAILAAVERVGLTCEIQQTHPAEDDQRDPSAAIYRVALARRGDTFGAIHGTAREIVDLFATFDAEMSSN